MGIFKYLRSAWRSPSGEQFTAYKAQLAVWRTQPVTFRVEHPTRLDRARALGFKAKNGFVVVRQRVDRGARQRPDIKGGRRSKHSRQLKVLEKNYQSVAEERAARAHPNLEVLNSYYVGKDGLHYWYEIILVDNKRPEIRTDKNVRWMAQPQHRRRVMRGLTSAARKSRGLRNKGKGAEKVRPSLRAHARRN
jgi:large subunit ribosomal protein L15e